MFKRHFLNSPEFLKMQELMTELLEKRLGGIKSGEQLEEKLDSLAKILGYEYVSKAVKEDIRAVSCYPVYPPQEAKAVLRYSWEKINNK